MSASEAADLDSLVRSLSAQISSTGWVDAELARKSAGGEPVVNIFDIAAAVKAEEEKEALGARHADAAAAAAAGAGAGAETSAADATLTPNTLGATLN